VKHHAKASSAGSTTRQANDLGRIFRGAALIRGASSDADGSGAPSGGRLGRAVVVSALALVSLALFASQALAASAPSVDDTYATDVITKEGKLHAEVNPNEAATTYQFQYVDQAHYQPLALNPYAEGEVTPASPQSIGSGTEDVKVSREIEGLIPGTTYHYRVVAINSEGTTNGPDRAIRTFLPFSADSECANQGVRYGAATSLPDCRGYEMVSPVDKNNGDIKVLASGELSYPSSVIQSTPEGEKLAYNSYRAFGDALSNPMSSQYIAQRTGEGWQTHSINPPKTENFFFGAQFYQEYEAFSEDLCHAWIVPYSDPPLAPGALEGYADLYRHNDRLCGPENFEAMVTFTSPPPQGINARAFRGASADGSHAIFVSNVKLSPQGTEGTTQLYESTSPGAAPQLVCILPNGTPQTQSCSAGSSEGTDRRDSLTGAISEDGERVFWNDRIAFGAQGRLYVRIGGTETLDVSKAGEEAAGTTESFFWGASPDGSRAIYTTGSLGSEGASLFAFELEGEETEPIAEGVRGLVGMSKDARRIYFVSNKDLGGAAIEGEPNLYFYDADAGGGTTTFITTLDEADTCTQLSCEGPISTTRHEHTGRVTPDGLHVAFTSFAPLTGYDNRDITSGRRGEEAYVYDAETEELSCASCNPSGARDHQLEDTGEGGQFTLGILPGYETNLYATRSLSDDGNRLYFESISSLTPRDTNGTVDVYEWEAVGAGSCDEADPTFAPSANGCINLISSGKSTLNSEFVDASANGDDVFINTLSSFLPQDIGLRDIYDARVGGGFPISTKVAACEGEACQNAPEAPNDPTPGSSSYNGPGNVTEQPAASKKHKKKHHKRRHAHKRHRANNNRRASR
jgi:WD40-like Beta Propeller Repeat